MLTKHSIQGKCCDLSSQTLSNLLLVLFLTFKTKLKFSPPGHCYLNPLIVFRQQVSFVWFSIWRLEKVLNEDFSSTGNGDIQEPVLHCSPTRLRVFIVTKWFEDQTHTV
jgi:hypothetical protein